MMLQRTFDLLFTAVFLALVFFQTLYVMRHNKRMFRSVHLYEWHGDGVTAPPSTYFSLDWLMHPLSSHYNDPYNKNVKARVQDCHSSRMAWTMGSCGPEIWQTADVCASKTSALEKTVWNSLIATATVRTVNPKLILEQLTEDNNKRSMDQNLTHIRWRNPNLMDVCRIERIPQMALVQNDDTSWSISAAHSSSVLLLGATLIMFISNLTNLLHDPPEKIQNYARTMLNFKGLIVLATLVLILVARFVSHNVEDVVRVVPNGSYFYVFATVLIGGYMLVNMRRNFEPFSEVAVAEVVANETEMSSTANFDLNVSGFATHHKTQLNAYMPHTAAPKGQGNVSETWYSAEALLTHAKFKRVMNTCDIQPSRLCTTQALSLPLLTLGIFIFPTNYALDSQVQLLFLMMLFFGIVDVVVHRLDHVTCIVGSLLLTPKTHTNFHKICCWVDVLAILVQVLLFAAVFVHMEWHLTMAFRELVPVLDPQSLFEVVMSWTPLLYVGYFVISTVVKILVLYSTNRKDKRDSKGEPVKIPKWLESLHHQSQFILLSTLNVFVACMLGLVSLYMWTEQYKHPITRPDATKNAMLDQTIHMYRSSVVMR